MVKPMWNYALNLPKATISSLSLKSYPILLLLTNKNNLDPLCWIFNASVSIKAPLLKNIKSSLLVAVKPVGADAVTAVKLAVLILTKLPVCVKDFRR